MNSPSPTGVRYHSAGIIDSAQFAPRFLHLRLCYLGSVHGERANFGGLVLGCIDSYDSESRRIFQDFSRSTRFTFLCTAQTSKFQEKTRPKFCRNETFSVSFLFPFQQKSMNFVIFLLNFDEILSEFHEKFQEITKVESSNFFEKQR